MQALAKSLVGVAATSAMFGHPLLAQTSRDSAGVLIVENTRPAWSDSERVWLATNPRLVIGNNTDSAYRFRQVRGVMLLADGRIAVADGASLQLRMFSPQGRFLSVSAGKGTGPGQLLNMHAVRHLSGDTIAVDAGFSTLALYSNTGHFVRTVALSPPEGGPAGRLLLVEVLKNGARVAAPLPHPTPRTIGSRWTDSLVLRLITGSKDSARELGTFPYMEFEQVSSGPTPVWLSAIGVFAAGDDRFYAGFGNRYAIRVYTSKGNLQSIIRRSWKSEPITADDWEHWVVEWSKLWVKATGAERDREVQKVREEPWAEELPAFSQFIVDLSGRLWVRGAHWRTRLVRDLWAIYLPCRARGRCSTYEADGSAT
jgi:hypothetical protein